MQFQSILQETVLFAGPALLATTAGWTAALNRNLPRRLLSRSPILPYCNEAIRYCFDFSGVIYNLKLEEACIPSTENNIGGILELA